MIAILPKRNSRNRVLPASRSIPVRKMELGQVMTPAGIARFMATLFTFGNKGDARVLDPGAGTGALSTAFVEEWAGKVPKGSLLDLTAYEVDPSMLEQLEPRLRGCCSDVRRQGLNLQARAWPYDFIQAVANPFEFGQPGKFTHAILNPPYKKIASDSMHRNWLRDLGIETVNLYSGFVALALQLLAPGGQLVAIIPRSFCNGPYYRPFRSMLLRNAAIERIHLFESRKEAFKSDGVLQENVIIKLVRGARQESVVISTSRDGALEDYQERKYRFEDVVKSGDTENFIRIPSGENGAELSFPFRHRLDEMGIQVSTGPVVDFRVKDILSDEAERGMVPLLYPCHFSEGKLRWPVLPSKKKNAIRDTAETRRWLYPSGCYVVTRRLSSKEEPRRIVANMVTRAELMPFKWVGFENHLNVFHMQKNGLEANLARGLCMYLNSTLADRYFRDFNGHTQVNATDLRELPYPSARQLMKLGGWAAEASRLSQEQIDSMVEKLNES